MHEIRRSIDHATDLLGTENGGQFPRCLGKRQIIKMDVAAFEHLLEEEPQCGHSHLYCAGRELSFLQQVPLESLNMRGSQSVRRFTEMIGELFDRQDVAPNCGSRIVAALEFLHHPLS